MSDLELFLIVIGSILLTNIISLIVAIKVYPDDFHCKNIWTRVFYYVYFIIMGFTYWFKIGFEKLYILIKNGK